MKLLILLIVICTVYTAAEKPKKERQVEPKQTQQRAANEIQRILSQLGITNYKLRDSGGRLERNEDTYNTNQHHQHINDAHKNLMNIQTLNLVIGNKGKKRKRTRFEDDNDVLRSNYDTVDETNEIADWVGTYGRRVKLDEDVDAVILDLATIAGQGRPKKKPKSKDFSDDDDFRILSSILNQKLPLDSKSLSKKVVPYKPTLSDLYNSLAQNMVAKKDKDVDVIAVKFDDSDGIEVVDEKYLDEIIDQNKVSNVDLTNIKDNDFLLDLKSILNGKDKNVNVKPKRLPLITKKGKKANDLSKQAVSKASDYWRRNSFAEYLKYGVPFELEVSGLAQGNY